MLRRFCRSLELFRERRATRERGEVEEALDPAALRLDRQQRMMRAARAMDRAS
jgi:hypothetical protein